jgi:hypothetical protein
MALQKRPKPGNGVKYPQPIKPGKPTRPGDSINKPGKPSKPGKPTRPKDPIKKLPRPPGSGNPELDRIRKEIEDVNRRDAKYVDTLYNTYPM